MAYIEDEYQTSDKYLRDLDYAFVLGLRVF